MANLPSPPEPVKFFAAILWKGEGALDRSLARIRETWGGIDHEGPDHPFDATDYYEREMGPDLKRRIVSFVPILPPESLVEVKLAAMAIEEELRGPSGRRINLDVGYMDVHKVVLGSVKYAAQKIHLGKGVHADIVCRYSKGAFHSFEWSFPDFKDGRYEEELLRIRELYKVQLRRLRGEALDLP